MSDSAIRLAGSPKSVFVAWQSLQRSTGAASGNGKRQKRRGIGAGGCEHSS